VAPLLYVHSMQDVVIERPPSVDPYSAPAIPLGKLLRFTPRTSFGHRVKVSGLVTYQRPGKMLVIEEAGQGLLLETREKIAVRPGDVIEAAGFPVMRTYSPVLEDVTYRRLRQGMPPAPNAATAASLLNGTRDAMLVSLEAHLLDSIQQHEERVLFLQADNLAFTAHLAIANWGTVARDSIDSKLRQGSWLRLTGVCIVEDALEEAAQLKPRSIRLVLRSPEDIVVVREPPWWTTKRLVGALVFALAIILAALAWVGMLRRRVRQQTELIGRKREHETLLEERHRIAREFHDTLEQELVGTKMQLDIVADKREEDPEVAAFSLGLARQMVVRSLEEVSGLIWDLRANDLKNGSLAAGLTQLAARVQDLSGMDIQLEVLGGARRLPPLTEHHLLRICQEGLNNAIRHAHARHVRLMLRYEPERVLLQVADDGNGFVLDPQSTGDGHFGIIGMRERTRKIGGELQVQTRPGEGTQITIELFSDSQPGLAPAPNGKGARSDHR
jgi:signal transduction histidine kinase